MKVKIVMVDWEGVEFSEEIKDVVHVSVAGELMLIYIKEKDKFKPVLKTINKHHAVRIVIEEF